MRKFRKYASIIIVMMMLFLLGACGASDPSIPMPQKDDDVELINVTGNIEAVIKDGKIIVSSNCNLLKDAVMRISIDNASGKMLSSQMITKDSDEVSVEFEIKDDWSGKVYAFLVCAPKNVGEQPKSVTEVYGSKFQNIDGESVIWDNNGKMLVLISKVIEL